MAGKESTSEAILSAAEDVILDVGAMHLTLDAVSARAGLSKGGLLYHFPTKDALLQAMVERHVQRHEDARRKAREKLPEGPSRELKARILSWRFDDDKTDRLTAAIIAAAVYNPSLVEPARRAYNAAFEDFIAQGARPERVAAVTLAVDGLWFLRLLGVCPFDKAFQDRIIDELLRLADD